MNRLVETWEPGRPVPLSGILGALRRGAGDPTMVIGPRDLWWGVQTPWGPAATWWRLEPAPVGERVVLRAFGAGAAWFGGRVPGILGDDDRPESFVALHEPVRVALRSPRHRHWRAPRTGLVVASLVPSILEQKVTGKQAFAGYRYLVRRHGERIEFPTEVLRAAGRHAEAVARLVAPPSVQGWRRIPSWDWLQAGVEPPQSRTVMRAMEYASALEATVDLPLDEAHRRLRSVRGIGVWTAAKVAQTAWGDVDSPTFADYHVAKQIGHALLGRDVDDAGMARLLEPYRGQRFRAERLILAGAPPRARHGARMSLPAHLPQRAWR